MTPPALAFESVSCLRGQRLLFEDLSFALTPGEALLVSGPNGAGKSSLLRIAAGLLAPAMGRVQRSGAFAFVGDATALDERLPLARALSYWARIDGGDDVALEQGLAAMAIAPLRDVPVRMLSTGQRKRAMLARAIAGGAGVWLLDEPGNGLDAESLGRLDRAMALHRAGGGIIVATSHQPLGLPDAQALRL
jgi:heme exporter protein A